MDSKTYLTPQQARARWGSKLKVPLSGGGSMYRSFDGEGGVWRPEYDKDMALSGYRLVKLHPTTKPNWRRRGGP